MIFATQLRSAAQFAGDREAVRCDDIGLTFAEVYERSCRLSQVLARAGLRPGDRVSSLGRNRVESVEEIAGVALGGFVRSPLYMFNSTTAHLFMMRRVEARALIVDAEVWSTLGPAARAAGLALELVLVRGARSAGMTLTGHELDYDDALVGSEPVDPDVTVDERDIHIIRFSAGTTGDPKPIALSWRNWHGMGNEMLLIAPPLGREDTELVISPYSHGSGNLFWPMISVQARQLILPKFDPGNALELIEKERCSVLFLVPTMIQLMVDRPDSAKRDLRSLKIIYYGAAPLSEATLRKAINVWGTGMYQCYGQSEAAPVAVLGPEHHDLDGDVSKLATQGRATPNSALRIEDAEGNVLPPNTTGQVVVTGPGQMMGIYGDEAATRSRITEDGWVRTGDMGELDEEGFLRLKDRMEDLIISGGFNIWPAEVENTLMAHPKVLEVVVFGAPHPKWGETPVAVVHVEDPSSVSADELMAWCREQLGPVKRPRHVVILGEDLAKSSAGKLLRRQVRSDLIESLQFG